MAISFQIQLPPSLQGRGAIEKIDSREVVESGASQVVSLLKAHISTLPDAGVGKHYDPSKVSEPKVSGSSAEVTVDIPGISRAFHDIVIRPVNAQALSIPLSQKAKGKSPREYAGNLFMFRSKAGNLLLAERAGRDLVLAYALKESVTQRRDPSLLPSEEDTLQTFYRGIQQAIQKILTT